MGVRANPLHHGRYWDASLNVTGSCEIADRSCYFCYAPPDAAGIQSATDVELWKDTTVWRNGRWTWNERLTVLPPEHPAWTFPLRWKGVAAPLLGEGKPSLLWVNSMADLFHPGRPPQAIDRILSTVAISRHVGLVVTKHCAQCVEYFSQRPAWWRKKFILLFSAGDQKWWDLRWAIMRAPAERGWVVGTSIQPMLEPVVLPPDFLRLGRWVIVGGEQPPGNRYMDPNWVRSLLGQCLGVGMPFFVKQMTRGWIPPDLLFRQFPQV
jgi:protein gp37